MQQVLSNSQDLINASFANYPDQSLNNDALSAVQETISLVDTGQLRVAVKVDGLWQINEWIKKAILLYLYTNNAQLMSGNLTNYFDKVPLKFANYSHNDFLASKVRLVPNAAVRYGSYIGVNSVIMPSYINLGAYIDSGCMIDTWATVGSCAQIGKNVHLSGGAGIGGVLEPLQASPTIIEDNCFIGARSEIVEGVVVEENSVIGMGVFIGQSTKIYNRITGELSYGRVPAGSVIVPGSLPASDNSHSVSAAIIIKTVDAQTRSKTSINELLRG